MYDLACQHQAEIRRQTAVSRLVRSGPGPRWQWARRLERARAALVALLA